MAPRASVPPCCQLILKEVQEGILNIPSDGERLWREGLASLLVTVCACPQTLTRREEKRIFSVNPLLCEPQPSLLAPLLIFHCCFSPPRSQPAGQIHLGSCPLPTATTALSPVPLSTPWHQTLPKTRGETFPVFLPADSPRGGCGCLGLPGLIEIRLSAPRLGSVRSELTPSSSREPRPGTPAWERARPAGLGG